MVSIVVVEEVSYGQLQSSAMLLGVKNGRAVNRLIILEGRIDGDFLRRLPLDSSFLIGHHIGF